MSTEGVKITATDEVTLARPEPAEALGEGLAMLRAISDASGDAIFAKDRAGRMRFANPATLTLIGKPLEAVLGRTDAEFLDDPAAARQVMENDRRVMESGVAVDLEEEVPLPDGTRRVWASRKAPYRDAEGRVVGLLGISRDITDRKRAEEALRESEERYRSLFENMAEGFALGEAILDEAGQPCDFRFLEMNDAFEVQSGLRRADVQGRPMRSVLPHLEQDWIDRYCGVARTGKPLRFESHNKDLGRHFSVICYSPAPGRFAILFNDVTERTRADEELRRTNDALNVERDKLTAVIGALPVGVGITDARGTTLAMNEAGLRLHGFGSHDEMLAELSRYAERFELRRLGGEVLPLDEWPAAKAMRGEFVAGEELVLRNVAKGTHRIASYSVVPVRSSSGEILMLVYVMQDVTDRKRDEVALQRANEQLREADRRKDEFLGVLSHELRNPLAPIRNSIYVLGRADPGGEQARRARAVIQRQTDHLTRLVDDLLDVTRVARGKVELRRDRIDLAEVIRRAGEDHRAVVATRGVALLVEVPRESLWADADATRIAQVVGNLLQNSAKFTPRGGEIRLSVRARDGAAEVRVRDTGIGIEPALLGRVFEPFVQSERSLARTQGGLGLGLALVKGIVELHGGSVRVESDGPERGAEFTVVLPLVREAPAERPAPPASDAGARGRLVLVVDDNRDAAESLAELVELLGHRAQVAYDGPSAVEMAEALSPDVVLCDIGLPGMSGYDVARALRAREPRPVHLVAVSGYAQPEDLTAAFEAGFDEHVAKPPDPARLERLLA